jgi:hypothetical protein
MRWVPTSLELAGVTILAILGLYLLHRGALDPSATVLIGGALFFTFGVTALVFAIRNARWHRQMLRHSVSSQKIDLD